VELLIHERVRVLLPALVLPAVQVSAHHSFAAQYDAAKPVELKGTVTKVEWTNPHARFYIDVKDATGEVLNWNFELASPNVLVRNGWKRNTLQIGAPVTVVGYLGRSGVRMAIATGVTAADGRALFASSGPGSTQ
jgi:Family of unknown function (DUF6152)